MIYKNYHGILTPKHVAGEPTVWVCDYCGASGPITKMQKGDCTFIYPVCKVCGGSKDSNECLPDCAGIATILADPNLYIAGTHEDS